MHIFIEQKKGTEVETDLFVFGFFQEDKQPGGCFSEMDQLLGGQLSALIQNGEVRTDEKFIQVMHTFGKILSQKILFVGLGEKDQFDFEKAREIFGHVFREILKAKAKKISCCLDSFLVDEESAPLIAHAFSEAAVLSTYSFSGYKTDQQEENALESVSVCLMQDILGVEQALRKGRIYGEGTCMARDLVNTPGNLLTPVKLAEKAVEMASRYGFEYEILGRDEMHKKGMGALLAVAQGGEQPPQMIVLKYQGLDQWKNVLGLVGKGITFDTGGISLKPAQKMHEMKMDMGGAAAVLGTMEVIGQLQPQCNVLAVIPSTENMPDGKSVKPGDVITAMSGKTIEVINTDAEGRLILADGLTYAKQLGANYLVDVATLTGAVLIALGNCTTGVVTNDEDFVIEVLECGQEAGEYMWRLPDFEPYKKLVKSSDVADLNNAPGRLAGSITGGLFIGEFAEDTPWVHLDIAGTAWADKGDMLTPKGATGVMVRTLSTLAERFGENKTGLSKSEKRGN